MSEIIRLQAIPNQTLSVQIGDDRYEITIKAAGSIMAATITLDEAVLVSNSRIVSGTPLIPYRASEGGGGNFMILTENNEIPRYNAFGINQTLVSFTAAELAAARG